MPWFGLKRDGEIVAVWEYGWTPGVWDFVKEAGYNPEMSEEELDCFSVVRVLTPKEIKRKSK